MKTLERELIAADAKPAHMTKIRKAINLIVTPVTETRAKLDAVKPRVAESAENPAVIAAKERRRAMERPCTAGHAATRCGTRQVEGAYWSPNSPPAMRTHANDRHDPRGPCGKASRVKGVPGQAHAQESPVVSSPRTPLVSAREVAPNPIPYLAITTLADFVSNKQRKVCSQSRNTRG